MNTLPQSGMPSQATLNAQATTRDSDNASSQSDSDSSSFRSVLSQQVAQGHTSGSSTPGTATTTASTASTASTAATSTSTTTSASPADSASAGAAQAAVQAKPKSSKSDVSTTQPLAHAPVAVVPVAPAMAAVPSAASVPAAIITQTDATTEPLASTTSAAASANAVLADAASKLAESLAGGDDADATDGATAPTAAGLKGAGNGEKSARFELTTTSYSAVAAAQSQRGIAATSGWSGADGSSAEDAPSGEDKGLLRNATSVDIPTTASTQASFNDAAGALAAAGASTPGSAAATNQTAVASATVPYQLGSDAWAQDVSSHVLYFSQQDTQVAQLHLNPQHLGPLNIEIKVENNQTSVAFSAAHEATRQAMQDSLPQLHELFAQHGVSLGSTTVGDGSAGSSQFSQNGSAGNAQTSANSASSRNFGNPVPAGSDSSGSARLRSLSMVDTFA